MKVASSGSWRENSLHGCWVFNTPFEQYAFTRVEHFFHPLSWVYHASSTPDGCVFPLLPASAFGEMEFAGVRRIDKCFIHFVHWFTGQPLCFYDGNCRKV